MQMDTRIPMMAQNPNPLQAYTSGISAADAVNQINQRQAYQDFITQSGEALYQGDEAALQRYAAFDPEGAFALRGQFEQRAAQQAAQARAAANAGAASREAQESDQIKQVLSIMDTAYDAGPDEFAKVAEANGLTGMLTEYNAGFDNYMAASAGLRERVGYSAQVMPEPVEVTTSKDVGGVLRYETGPQQGERVYPDAQPEPKPGYRAATQEEAAAHGAVSGQVDMSNNKFTADPTPSGMKISSTPDGGFMFESGAGVTGGASGGMDEGMTGGTTKVAKGYERIPQDDGTFRDVLIKGSPTWATLTDQSQKTGTALESFQAGNAIVDDMINRAIEIVESESIPTTGLIGWASQGIPQTPAHALQQELLGIQTNTAFDFLADMRRNSPTGGAVGQLSDSEREAMSAIMGSLKQSNRKSDLLYNLRRLQVAREDAESRLVNAYDQDFDQLGYTFGAYMEGPTVDGINGMTDAQIRNFDREKLSTMSKEALDALFERSGGL